MNKTDVSSKCNDCYLRKDCDEWTGFICKSNDFCKYVPESPDRTTVTIEWYMAKIHELQDWLLEEKIIPEDIPIIKEAYEAVLHKVIDMFTGADTDYTKLVEQMDEWS